MLLIACCVTHLYVQNVNGQLSVTNIDYSSLTIHDYLEYNSTINCSLMFSGTNSLSGYVIKVPFISVSFQSTQLNFWFLPRIGLVTEVLSLDFSFKLTISPG